MIDYKKEILKCGMTIEQYEQSLSDIFSKVKGEKDIDWSDIVKCNNIPVSKETMRKAASQKPYGAVFVHDYLKSKQENNASALNDDVEKLQKSYGVETKINPDGSESSNKLIQMSEKESKDVNYLLKAHGFAPEEWTLVSAKNSIWNSHNKKDGMQTLYSSKITVKPKKDELTLESIDKHFITLAKEYSPPPPSNHILQNFSDDGMMLEIPIVDLHLGKFSTVDDVGTEYNYKIARECFNFIIDDIIDNVKGKKIKKIIFPVGADFFHVDTLSSTTTAGTQQITDLSPQVMFDKGMMMLIDGITKLSKIAPVDVFYVPGNHDFLTSYHVVCALWAFFLNNTNVKVDKDVRPRKYVEFGKCLVGFAHGDKEKENIYGIMQNEVGEAWGRTMFHEFHLSHRHKEESNEKNGVLVKRLPSVSGTDIWHCRLGFIGSIRKTQSYLWDANRGCIDIHNSVIL